MGNKMQEVKGITLFITFSSFLYILLDLHVAAVRQLRFPIRHQRLGAVGRGHSHHLPHSTTNFHKIRCSTTNDDVTSSRLTNLSTTRERHENIYLDLVHVEGWVHDLAVALPFVAVGEHEALAEEAGDVRGLVSFLGYSPVWSESTCFTTFTSAMHTFGRAPVQSTNVWPAHTLES
jgi:hypothetical protein